jgi:hypothetical protein
MLFEVEHILVHAVFLIPADEPTDGVCAEHGRSFEDSHHEIVLLLSYFRIVMQHVVEVRKVG